jgi:hypothetical protein
MAFYLTLFCESGLDNSGEALGMLVSEAEQRAEGLAVRNRKHGEGWASCEVGSAVADDETILLEMRTDQPMVQKMVSSYGAQADAPHIADSDLLIILTLVGDDPDWALVRDLWIAAAKLWHVVPHSDVTGFDIGLDSLP